MEWVRKMDEKLGATIGRHDNLTDTAAPSGGNDAQSVQDNVGATIGRHDNVTDTAAPSGCNDMQSVQDNVGATIGRLHKTDEFGKPLRRKKNRLENFDYSTCGGYFVTICTSERRNYFWANAKVPIGCPQDAEIINHPQDVKLSDYGKIVDIAINNIPVVYPAVSIEEYIVMPDHVHILLVIHADESGRPLVAPTLARIVQQFKGYVTKQIGFSIWQKLYFDHVIRNRQDYEKHVKYIYENPIHWYYDDR